MVSAPTPSWKDRLNIPPWCTADVAGVVRVLLRTVRHRQCWQVIGAGQPGFDDMGGISVSDRTSCKRRPN